MKRLLVYLLVDCSGSMAGGPIQAVREGISEIIKSLQKEPKTAERTYVSVITFSDSAHETVTLTSPASFREPDLQTGGTSALGSALRLLRKCVVREMKETTNVREDDLKVLVFLMTDGSPTDAWEQEVEILRRTQVVEIVATPAGDDADEQLLRRITDKVVRLKEDFSLPGTFRPLESRIGSIGYLGVIGSVFPPLMLPILGGLFFPAAAILAKKKDLNKTIEVLSTPGVSDETKKETKLRPGDTVHFLVSSPPIVQPGRKVIVDVWAHLEQQRAEVERRIQQAISPIDSPPVLRPKGPFKIERGTLLSVRLRFQDFHVEPTEDVILWEGEIGNASFEIDVPAEMAEGPKVGSVAVHSENGILIARIPLQILVTTKIAPTAPTAQPMRHIRHAFASYANEDRDEVLGRIQGMQKIAPDLEVFLDVVKLRSGENWERKLWQVIPESDVFYLFWSAAAKASAWVEKEWRCALNSRGEEFIDPVPLVSPEDVCPPDELSKKHFNDWSLAYRRGKPKGEK